MKFIFIVYFFDALDLDNLQSKLGQIQYSLQNLEMLVLGDRGSIEFTYVHITR